MQIGVEVSRAIDNKRVFVIDSDEVTRAALTFMLQDENETHELASLAQAFNLSAERRPNLVLLGVDAARQAGPEIVDEVVSRVPGTKILIVADGVQDETTRKCLQRGAHGVLNRPFTIESVRRKVDRMLGRQVALDIPIEVR